MPNYLATYQAGNWKISWENISPFLTNTGPLPTDMLWNCQWAPNPSEIYREKACILASSYLRATSLLTTAILLKRWKKWWVCCLTGSLSLEWVKLSHPSCFLLYVCSDRISSCVFRSCIDSFLDPSHLSSALFPSPTRKSFKICGKYWRKRMQSWSGTWNRKKFPLLGLLGA